MSVLTDRASGASVLDGVQVLRCAPTPLHGAPAATWTPSPRTGVRQLRVAGTRPATLVAGHDDDENTPSRLHLCNACFWSEECDPPHTTLPRVKRDPHHGTSALPLHWRDACTLTHKLSYDET